MNDWTPKSILGYIWATTSYYALWLGSIVYLCTFFNSALPLWLFVLAVICKPYAK